MDKRTLREVALSIAPDYSFSLTLTAPGKRLITTIACVYLPDGDKTYEYWYSPDFDYPSDVLEALLELIETFIMWPNGSNVLAGDEGGNPATLGKLELPASLIIRAMGQEWWESYFKKRLEDPNVSQGQRGVLLLEQSTEGNPEGNV